MLLLWIIFSVGSEREEQPSITPNNGTLTDREGSVGPMDAPGRGHSGGSEIGVVAGDETEVIEENEMPVVAGDGVVVTRENEMPVVAGDEVVVTRESELAVVAGDEVVVTRESELAVVAGDEVVVNGGSAIDEIVKQTVAHCKDTDKANNPVEILRHLQSVMVTGRPLELTDTSQSIKGTTNFIMVDRCNLLKTGLEEIKALPDYRATLEVQFYNEVRVVGPPGTCFFGSQCGK